MKAAIYARVSTERQAERGTIGSQVEQLSHRTPCASLAPFGQCGHPSRETPTTSSRHGHHDFHQHGRRDIWREQDHVGQRANAPTGPELAWTGAG